MLNVEFTLNVLSLILLISGASLTGFILRSRQLKQKQDKIAELRREIIYNHAQILELQTEYVALEKSVHINKTPVLPMNTVIADSKETATL